MPELLNAFFLTQFRATEMILPFIDIQIGNPIGLDSYFALIASGLFSAHGTFMLRQFFMGLPVIIVFILGQRYFVEGIRPGAIKA